MYSVQTGVFVSNDGRVVTAKSLSRKDMDDAAKQAAEYDLQDARKLANDLRREPTPRELLTRTVRHPDLRSREQKTVVREPQARSAEQFLTDAIADLEHNPGGDPADRASRKRQLKRFKQNLKDLEVRQEAQNEKVANAVADLQCNPVTIADQGRKIHANELLKQLSMLPIASIEDCERAAERTQLRGSAYDDSLAAWRTEFLNRVEQQTEPTPDMTVGRARELLNIREQVKKIVEMPGNEGVQKANNSSAKNTTVQN
jgi:hypothetical protein